MNPLIYRRFKSRSQQGLTIVEALMGLTVATAIIAATAPLLLIAVSTRFYNANVEQAGQLAQAEINRVQTVMSQGVPQAQEAGVIPPPAAVGVRVNQVGAPTSTVTTMADLDAPLKALLLDVNRRNDGNRPDFMIQMFRDRGLRFTEGVALDQLAVFRMGVRVYSALAANNLGNLSTVLAPINLIQGIGQQRVRPLAVFYTEISRSDIKLSLQRYRDYLNSL